MKELSIKEKAYDGNYKVYTELINRLENVKNAIKKQNYGIAMDILYKPYPEYQITTSTELKECEDLRITKAIKYGLDHVFTNNTTVFEVTKEQCLSWLEKQGEHSNFLSKIQVGDKVTRNEDGVLVNLSQLNRVAKKQTEQKLYVNDNAKEMFIKALECVEEQNNKGYKLTDCDKNSWWEDFKAYTSCTIEQKPTGWSEKLIADVFEMVGLTKIVREQENDALTRALQSAMIELAKYSVVPQIRQEWSEEDEILLKLSLENLTELKDRFGEYYGRVGGCIDWLKSLRPQSQWKPSDEQMNALNYVVNLMASSERPTENDLYYNILKSLRQQLMKLKG